MSKKRIYELTNEQTTIVDADNGIVDKSGYARAKKYTMLNLWNYIKSKADSVYQSLLVSGTNIKTINGDSILGSGDLEVGGTDTNIATNDLTFTQNSTTNFDGYKATFTNAELEVQGELYSKGGGNISTNTAYGNDIFKSNTSGGFNVGLGQEVLKALTSGNGNLGVGRNILNLLETGTTNFIIGTNSGNKITTASFNITIGTNNLSENQTGNYNIGIGTNVLANATSNSNVIIGNESGVYISGGYFNSFLGHGTGLNLTSGHTNLFLGYLAGLGITTGQGNVIIGTDVTQPSGLNNSVVIGRGAVATADNQLVIGSSLANAGEITTTAPTPDKKWKVKINGVDYYIPLQQV
jgi:hypothetical protein